MFKKIISYSFGLYAAALFGSITRVLVKSLIAKTLGKEALGAYAYYATVMVLATSILAFGLKRSVAKLVASRKEEPLFAPLVSAVMTIFIVASLILGGAALLLNGRLDWVYVLILVGVGPATLFDVACATLRGQFDQRREVSALLLSVVVQAGCILALVLLSRDMHAPVWGLATSYVLLGLATTAYFMRRYRGVWRLSSLPGIFTSQDFKLLMALTAPIWITEILGFISQQADALIVQGQLGYSALAEYAAAFTFIGLMDQPISVLSRVFLVTFAGGYYNDFEQYKQVTSINLLMFSAMGFGLALAASPLTPIFFTTAFTMTPALVIILTATSIFNSVEVINSSLTIAQDYPQANRNAKIIALVFYLPLAFFLTARYQVFGAAWSNVASWGIYTFVHALYMRRRMPEHGIHTLRTMAIGMGLYAGVIAVYWFTRTAWMMLAAVPVYFILGHFLKLWNLVSLPGMLYRLLPQKPKARSI